MRKIRKSKLENTTSVHVLVVQLLSSVEPRLLDLPVNVLEAPHRLLHVPHAPPRRPHELRLARLPRLQPDLGQAQAGQVQLAQDAAPVHGQAGLDQVQHSEDV